MTDGIDMLEAALQLVAKGFFVFPVHSIAADGQCTCRKPDCTCVAKHPLVSGGCKVASADAQRVRGWWSAWPHANIGIATGKDAGIFVLDVDEKSGGPASLAALEEQHESLPTTARSMTGGGGFHLFFRYPASQKILNSVSSIGGGLDIRGNGGYVVAPPSLHNSGRRYIWQVAP
jgi:hypothetical protein